MIRRTSTIFAIAIASMALAAGGPVGAQDAKAPRYRKVEGVGSVDDIKARIFAALA